MGAENDETASGERQMQLGENSRRAEQDATSSTSPPVSDPRVYLAAERTFLAWIRTSVSLMGFGFVIARFAIWAREFSVASKTTAPLNPVVSTWLGFGMVCVGVFVTVMAASRHRGYILELERGVANPRLHVKTSMILAGILALVGLAIAVHIIII
jgi:putative membrane protein